MPTGERIEITKGSDGYWHFCYINANGKPETISEPYDRFGACEDAARELYDIDVYVEHDDGSWSLWEKERSPAA